MKGKEGEGGGDRDGDEREGEEAEGEESLDSRASLGGNLLQTDPLFIVFDKGNVDRLLPFIPTLYHRSLQPLISLWKAIDMYTA